MDIGEGGEEIESEYSPNAISSDVSYSVATRGGNEGFLVRDALSGMAGICQGDGTYYAITDEGITNGNGIVVVRGSGIERILFDGGNLYFLSGGQWFAKYQSGNALPFLSSDEFGVSVVDIGNSGDDTYFASPDLYKVNYVTVQEVGIQMRHQNHASGTVVEIVPDE